MQSEIRNSRDLGLDFVRSIAIILVVIAHYSIFFYFYMDISPIIHGVGFFGVELFFVLSGFLIGRILIRDVICNDNLSSLLNFWKRRWYRTLPAYYLVWSILFFISNHDASNFVHLLMLQNFFYGPRDLFFVVSWSLAAEEWFYLFVPFLIYILLRLKMFNREKLLIYVCLIGIVLAPLLRLIAALLFEQQWTDIRKSSFIRLDAFLFGILIAAIKYYQPHIYMIIKKQKKLLLFLTIVGLGFCSTRFRYMGKIENIFNKTILFSLADLFITPFLILCESSNFFYTWKSSWKEKLIYFISVTSYAVYLIHWDIMMIFRAYQFGTASIDLVTILLLLCLFTTYILAFIIYQFWEKPFLTIRDNGNLIENMLSYKQKIMGVLNWLYRICFKIWFVLDAQAIKCFAMLKNIRMVFINKQ